MIVDWTLAVMLGVIGVALVAPVLVAIFEKPLETDDDDGEVAP